MTRYPDGYYVVPMTTTKAPETSTHAERLARAQATYGKEAFAAMASDERIAAVKAANAPGPSVGDKMTHPRLGLVRVVAVTEHEDGFAVARVVDARIVSNRGGVWVKVADLVAEHCGHDACHQRRECVYVV